MTQLSLAIPAVARPKMPAEPILRSADIEIVDGVWTYRWTMTRAWATGLPTILWVLLNPSLADGTHDDPTTQRMIGFSYRWGFGSMTVANIYPIVSSTVPGLRAWWKTVNRPKASGHWDDWDDGLDDSPWAAWRHNQKIITKLLSDADDMVCVAAWGNHAVPADVEEFRSSVRRSVDDEEFGRVSVEIDWHCLDVTNSGAPIHPLARGRARVPDDATLKLWRRARR